VFRRWLSPAAGLKTCCISPNIKVPGEVVLALSKLSEKRHGVIIVMENEDNLDEHLQGGVIIDAAVSAPILENIFYPGSPLHDGAAIIRDSKIRKVNVLLPLAPHTSELEALGLGSRHRAALGLSQVSDALIIVVSEAKGWISMALQGQFEPGYICDSRKTRGQQGDIGVKKGDWVISPISSLLRGVVSDQTVAPIKHLTGSNH
jgi:DNA integrity scanning protein DisA with diadenylate cyclase activity